MDHAGARTAIKSRVHPKPSASTISAAPSGQHESAAQPPLDTLLSRRRAVDLLPASILNLQRTAGNPATLGLLGPLSRVVQRDRPAWADTAGWPEGAHPNGPEYDGRAAGG
jgi:hypothetical protein